MYRLYVDEVGTDGLTHTEKDKHRYLSITGIAMRRDHARDVLEPNMNLIKARVFDHDPDAPVILHRKDIMGFKGPFEMLKDESQRELFDQYMLKLFETSDYKVITALIDKKWMLRQRHWRKTHPYHYLMEIIVEKYAQLLERMNAIGDIMPEKRHGKLDILLQKAFNAVREEGTAFVSSERIVDRIRARKLKFRAKHDNIAGLQLCDCLAHPSHIYARQLMGHDVSLGPFSTNVIDTLLFDKYDRSGAGKLKGYGIKYLPN